ncbi:Protein argonaute-2 [Orobanche minor]
MGDEQFLGNLCLKINAKLGGSNVELIQTLPHFDEEDHVMFIGADVNHPVSKKSTTPSIAAVVSTVNWPAVNRYAARVCPQDHRTEKILEFGSMCRDLVNTYFQLNKVRPKKIVVFRDGVSEGQFDMVLNEELFDLKNAICSDTYQPTITLVVAQKRHQTRLFLENVRDGGPTGNVPPGTVVDTKIVHPFEFDFYLCSHYGRIGTSKAVRYCVLWDENSFTSDQLQKLVYNLCFTFARSTRPVSLVPPVYYADLVAYRGRIFEEAAKEFQTRSFPPYAGKSVFSSNSNTVDRSFYNLHPDLQNIMFFV